MRHSAQATKGGEPSFVLGLGCERGAPTAEVLALAETALASAGLNPASLVMVASLDTRADEPGMRAVARHFAVPFRVFSPATLEAETWRLANPSEVVFRHTGCHGVAEAAALAAVGSTGKLVVAKMKSAHATAAIAESFQPVAVISSHVESVASGVESSTTARAV
ncbi:cobalamin biosynthesis protein [Rhizobium sp. ARZ01]|uniref:cobalamin biosynthesis protein n=1 Tax=Rhizobium sp. ARZ01 TaxID=2769313 RepID=UPI001784A7C1|nr:cobalamin biosynthesis protein [Rhizobium sp. ARZ01]MBD9372638.1 cobalamin biosynthesis protein [Rhizobium sp. ARZ01]